MAKFCGMVGFGVTSETSPGIWTETIVERKMYGDTIDNARRLEKGESINDDINIANQISIVADPYARQNFHHIKYVKFMGTNWKATVARVQFPRLILTLGGEYNA